jgi:hypothetical protein
VEHTLRRFVAVFLCLVPAFLAAEIITGPLGFAPDSPGAWYFDVPPGFEKTGGTPDGLGGSFASTVAPVQLVVQMSPGSGPLYGSTDTAGTLKNTLKRLGVRDDETETIDWYGHSATVGTFTFSPPVDPAYRHLPNTTSATGWGISVELAAQAGIVTAIAYADTAAVMLNEEALHSVMLSALDSLVIDQETRYSPGPITTFAWPKTTPRKQTVTIGGYRVNITLDAEDAEAAQSVIEREYAVLLLYQGSPGLYRSAWQRYYQQIFRDTAGRIRPAANAILDALNTDEEGALRAVLSWVQNQNYQRAATPSDFVAGSAILQGAGSDCDSRVILAAAVLHHAGSRTAIFVNDRLAHAWLGIQTGLPGVRKTVPQVGDYLLCETVSRVTPGMVPGDFYADTGWLPVVLSW